MEWARRFVVAFSFPARWDRDVVIEIWKLAISPGVLPLTILLVPMALFWVSCMLGAFDFEFLGFDGGEGGFDSGDGGDLIGGSMRWLFRFMNGDVVPLAAVLSFLLIFEWGAVMMGHHFFPTGGDLKQTAWIYLLGLAPAVLLAKLTTQALRPMFATLRGLEGEAKPVVGRAGKVRSRTCDEHSGQVEVEDPESPLLINARTPSGVPPLPRGARVVVTSHDSGRGIYLVTPHPEEP